MTPGSGYSGTPLVRKLGIKPGLKLLVMGQVPNEYRNWVAPLPAGARLVSRARPPFAAVHVFVTRRAELTRHLGRLRQALDQDGFVWVSWPKRTSRVDTDVTEDAIRDAALPLGLVDVKVCAVSDVWSGLKLVIRLVNRKPPDLNPASLVERLARRNNPVRSGRH